jgi:hypothetical protein
MRQPFGRRMTCLLGHAYYNEDNEPRFLRFPALRPCPFHPKRCHLPVRYDMGVEFWRLGNQTFQPLMRPRMVLLEGSHSGGVAGEKTGYYQKRTMERGGGKGE